MLLDDIGCAGRVNHLPEFLALACCIELRISEAEIGAPFSIPLRLGGRGRILSVIRR
jgi:hypothetical protein